MSLFRIFLFGWQTCFKRLRLSRKNTQHSVGRSWDLSGIRGDANIYAKTSNMKLVVTVKTLMRVFVSPPIL